MIKNVMERGLTKKQAKKMDPHIYRILLLKNPELLSKYIDALKGDKEFDKGFDIEYDLRKKNQKIVNDIGFMNRARIGKKAKAHEKLGIAKVFRDKSRVKLYGILSAIGVTTLGGVGVYALNSGNESKEPTKTFEQMAREFEEATGYKYTKASEKHNEGNKEQNNDEQKKDKDNDKDKEKDSTDKVNKENSDDKQYGGYYVKIEEGAILLKNPFNELRMMNGMNSEEKLQMKKSSPDKLYKVTKTEYCSISGQYVTVEDGESLEEALQKKGLDKSFIQDENTKKFVHVVADGIAQWVNVDSIEKLKIREDKFGNRIDKTDEEKAVDEAYENYMKENSRTYQNSQENQAEK